MGRVFLFLIACVLIELVLFGEFPNSGNFLTQNHFDWRESRDLSELFSLLPRNISLFLYTIDTNNMMFFVGLLITNTVYQSMVTTIDDQVKRRAVTIATNLNNGATMYLKKKNPIELHALLAKYVLLDDVAYVYIENGKDEILADNPVRISTELQDRLVPGGCRTIRWSIVTLRGQAIHDMRVTIRAGQIGAAQGGLA